MCCAMQLRDRLLQLAVRRGSGQAVAEAIRLTLATVCKVGKVIKDDGGRPVNCGHEAFKRLGFHCFFIRFEGGGQRLFPDRERINILCL